MSSVVYIIKPIIDELDLLTIHSVQYTSMSAVTSIEHPVQIDCTDEKFRSLLISIFKQHKIRNDIDKKIDYGTNSLFILIYNYSVVNRTLLLLHEENTFNKLLEQLPTLLGKGWQNYISVQKPIYQQLLEILL